MQSLVGTYHCKLDAKGRLALPSAFKKQLHNSANQAYVIKRSLFQSCLEIYPEPEWELVMERLNGLNRFVKKNNDFIRKFSAGVKKVELDGSGRLQISKDLMGFADLEKEVVVSAAINILEVWDEKSYERAVSDDGDFAELAEEVMGGINESSGLS